LLEETFQKKAVEFKDILICGRTHMQDAVPLTLGQQFGAYADALTDAREKVEAAAENLHYLGLGASALGTGLNTHKEYRPRVIQYLAQYTGFPLKQAKNYFQLTSSFGHFSDYSAEIGRAHV
jgi:aspartate ammonia-lyase